MQALKELLHFLRLSELYKPKVVVYFSNLKRFTQAHYIMYKTFLKDSKLQLAKESLKKAASNAPQDSTIREAFLKLEKLVIMHQNRGHFSL